MYCGKEGIMDLLMTSAQCFAELTNIEYNITIGRKGVKYEFTVAFHPEDFHHLAGLHKLPDIPAVRGSRERVFKNILNGKLTYKDIITSTHFTQSDERLRHLCFLENFMDSNEIIFKYDKSKNPSSRINALYLLENTPQDTTLYFFIDKDSYGEKMVGCSFFPRKEKDYSILQPKMSLLYKKKTYMNTGIEIIQYDKLHGQ